MASLLNRKPAMPAAPTPAQSDASRHNGARSTGPATDAGKAHSARNATRHGLTGRTFFLLADEDETDWCQHEALWRATWAPRDALEHEAALAVICAMWREQRADRLEVQVLPTCSPPAASPTRTRPPPPRPWRSRRSPPCCAIAAASSASTGRGCRRSTRCASASCAALRPRWCETIPSRPGGRPRNPHVARAKRSRASRRQRHQANPTGRRRSTAISAAHCRRWSGSSASSPPRFCRHFA